MKNKKSLGNFQSLIAILIVIVIFSSICFLILFALNRLGAFKLPKSLFNISNEETNNRGELYDIPKYDVGYDTKTMDLNQYKELIRYIPIQKSFYIQADVTNEKDNTPYHYWIWKYGEKYKIAILDFDTYRTNIMITCDGEKVKTVNVQSGETTYGYVKDGLSFFEQTPIIDLSKIGDNGYGQVKTVTLTSGNINYVIENNDQSVINLALDRDNLIPNKYEIVKNDVILQSFVLNSFEEVDYFTDEQFLVD